MSSKRLTKELHDARLSPQSFGIVSIVLVEDILTNWDVTILGPQDTPYEGGKFLVNIDFIDNYPFKSPKIRFKTKIYHPSVEQNTGDVCHEALGL